METWTRNDRKVRFSFQHFNDKAVSSFLVSPSLYLILENYLFVEGHEERNTRYEGRNSLFWGGSYLFEESAC